MSIEASYRRLPPSEFAHLQSDPKAAESFFGLSLDNLDDPEAMLARIAEQENSDRYLNIGKDWHALHFLLTGDGNLKPRPLPPPPLGNVVQGGTETEWPCTYGHSPSSAPQGYRTDSIDPNACSYYSTAERLTMPASDKKMHGQEVTPKKRRPRIVVSATLASKAGTAARRKSGEKHLGELERKFPIKSRAVFARARKKALDAGLSVLQSDQGVIYEVFPDLSRRKVKQIEKPTQLKRGLRLILR